MANFNINTKQVSDTTRVHLSDATGDKMYADDAETLPLEIEIYGKASKQYRNALAELSRKSMQRKGKQQSFSTNVEDNIEILVAISKVAFNFDQDGEPVDNAAAFRTLYSNANLFYIKDQVQEALEDNAAFLQK